MGKRVKLDRKAGISSDTVYDDLNVLMVLSTFAVETDLMGYLMIFIGTSTPLRWASQFGHAANNSSYGSYNRRVSGTFMFSVLMLNLTLIFVDKITGLNFSPWTLSWIWPSHVVEINRMSIVFLNYFCRMAKFGKSSP